MPAHYINTPAEFVDIMNKEVMKEIMEKLAQRTEELIQRRLQQASISTRTMQEYTTHKLTVSSKTCKAVIYIDDAAMQEENQEEGTYGRFNKFMSLDLSISYGGMTIAWHLIDWIERGVDGDGLYIGNQPIKPTHTFERAFADLGKEMDRLVKQTIASLS